MASADGRKPSQDNMAALYRDMRRKGYLDNINGACTVKAIAQEAREYKPYTDHPGYTVALEWDYGGDALPHDWLGVMRQNMGIRPAVLQFAQGKNLIDCETQVRDEAAVRGLRYHAAACIGKQADGYVFVDGDHPQALKRRQIYNLTALMAASVCGLLMLDMEGAQHVATLPGYDVQGDGYLGPVSPIDQKRYLVRGGILDYLKSHTALVPFLSCPVGDIVADGNGKYHQDYLTARIDYDDATKVAALAWIGASYRDLLAQNAALQKALDEEHAQNTPVSDERTQKALALYSMIAEAK